MKKFFFLFVMALMPFSIFAGLLDKTPIFGKYGFSNQSSFDSFQQYVGKTVMYIPCDPLSFAETDVFKTQKFVPGAEYVITKISRSSGLFSEFTGTYLGDIIITFKEKEGKKKLKMTARADWACEIPFFFIDDFNADKSTLIGKSFTDPLIKGEYKVTDIKLENTLLGKASSSSNRIKEVRYYLSNSEINHNCVKYVSLGNAANILTGTMGSTGMSDLASELKKIIANIFNEDKSGAYTSTLVKVEKPENSSERYGEIKTIEEKDVTQYSFEDELIDITICGGFSQFNFKLKNKSQSSIKIVWDDAVFVDYSGSTSKVMHSGIKYSQREASQPASTIIRGASLEDTIVPTSNVRYSDDLKMWVTDSLYPENVTSEVKQIRLMLPIQIKDVVNEYVFIFDVSYGYLHPERLKIQTNTKKENN